MTALVLSLVGAYGVHLLYTAIVHRWSGLGVGDRKHTSRYAPWRLRCRRLWTRAGLDGIRPRDVVGATVVVFIATSSLAYAVFGTPVVAAIVGLAACGTPLAARQRQQRARLAVAQDAWPRLIEELRIQVGAMGKSVPQALLDVGNRGPLELRPAFARAQREWSLSTNFERTIAVLEENLADPTADAACETLLIAHELGGVGIDRRLQLLAEDRRLDAHYRKDARAQQAGVRFARRFVLVVPAGMAAVGFTIGDGRSAYATSLGQLAVLAAIAMVLACWMWAGRLMRLPAEPRVFSRP